LANSFVVKSQINVIYEEDVDIYSEEGRLLVRFRKKILTASKCKKFYDATYKFTSSAVSGNRGSATGSKKRDVYNNPRIKSAILGYFDRWAPKEKVQIRRTGIDPFIEVRETRFSANNPQKFKQTFPLIQEINSFYRKLLPECFKKQNAKAKETPFKIPKTAFTTITTNINFQTSIHKDRGDDKEGFGNLAVIQRGKYAGGEICLPQYGFGVDVREGDLLFMDVHEWHGNLPIRKIDANAVRMSIVCYLRTNVWKRTKNKGEQFKTMHLKSIQSMKKKSNAMNKTRKK
jgi:hypothetical protein